MDAARISSLRENRFFPRKCHHNDSIGGCDLSQNFQTCLTDPMIPSVTF